MAEQILSPLVGKLIDYIAAQVGSQFGYLFCYSGNLEEFISQLLGLEMERKGVKLKVEAAERNGEVILPNVEDWLKKVDKASDGWKELVDEEDAISKVFFKGPLNLKVRYQRSKKAMEIAVEIKGLMKLKFDSVSVPARPLPIGSMNNENEFDFESRRSIFNQIMEAIKDDEVGMIGIWGMPGIGKTTLVKRVAKCARDEGLFQEVALAVVAQNPSIKKVQGQIADKIGLNLKNESDEGRADQLFQRLLAMKKILIILDDIWERVELNNIGIPSGSQHKGCKIILTSRIRGVCEEMGTRKNFTIDLLTANEALDLFLKMSGVDDRCSEKGRLAEKLSEECGHLPISIAITARGLLNKEQNYWINMLIQLRNSDPDKRVNDTIKLSYDNLNREEEKKFFLLCALFPEDCEIPVQVLFEYGLGLNLFDRINNVDEAEVRAHNLALRLKSQCLLLDEGDENFVKMHDVIRDVARVIASDGKYVFLVPATSFMSNDVKKLPNVLECPQLQILMLDCFYGDFQLHDNFFARMKNLIVLDMSFMKFVPLPQSFSALENLQTLRFNECILEDISAIGKLQNLVCLSFYGSDIKVLPKVVGELSNLRLLDLSNCYILTKITPGVIQNLSQLEVLLVGGYNKWCHPTNAGLSELIHLSSCLKILEICIPDASMLPDDVVFEKLMKFKVSIGKYDSEWQNIFFSNSQILKLGSLSENELLKAGIQMLMKKAQHLELKYISGISIALSSHLGGYGSLKELIVNHCLDVNYILDVNESKYETPSLQQLHLIELPSLQAIWHIHTPVESFFQLKVLTLTQCPELLVVFPPLATSGLRNLEEICIENCHKLKTLFQLDDAPLRNLQEICIESCDSLETLFQLDGFPLAIDNEMVLFPQLLTLKLVNLPKFTAFLCTTSQNILQATDQQLLTFFPKLKKLELEGIGRLSWTADLLHIIKGLEALEKLRIKDNNSKTLPQVIATLPKLRKMQLGFIHEPIEWSKSLHRCGGFQSLTSLNFFSCNGVKSLLGPSAFSCLVQLEKLFVSDCETMESIVGETTEEQNFDKVIEFSKLRTLNLDNLPCLASFYNEECAMKFPCLGRFSIKDCPKLKTFVSMSRETPEPSGQNFEYKEALFGQQVSFGRLSHLELERLESMEEIWHRCHPATTVGKLYSLSVKGCHRLLELFPSNLLAGLQKLGELHVQSCWSLEHVFAVEDHPPLLSSLWVLEFNDLPELKQLWWNNNTRESFGFPRLYSLTINTCPKLQFIFDTSVANRLENFRILNVMNCSSMVEIVAEKPGKKIEFPLLDTLSLANLPELKQLWWNKNTHESFGLPSLDDFTINTCPTLQFIFDPSVANRLENLRRLVVENCSSIVEIVAEKSGKKIEFPLLRNLFLVNLPCFKVNQSVEFPLVESVYVDHCFNIKEHKFENLRHELAGSMRFFESFVELARKQGYIKRKRSSR